MESGDINPNTKRSHKSRNKIYLDKKVHQLAIKTDRARKNEVNRNAQVAKENDQVAKEIYQEKQREAERKYHPKKKAKMLENVQEQDVVKFMPRKNGYILKNKFPKISKPSSSSTPDPGDKPTEPTNRMIVSQSLWGTLSPKTQSKAKSAKRNKKLPRGTNFQLRKELGVNLSNKEDQQEVSETPLQKAIKSFFCQDDVTRVCLNMKKAITNPRGRGKI